MTPLATRSAPLATAAGPLAATLARLAGRVPGEEQSLELCAGRPRGAGWHTRAGALAPATLEDLLARTGRHAGTRLRAVQGTWLLEAYAGGIAAAGAATALAEDRLPDPAPAHVALRIGGEGVVTAVALAGAFGALSGDGDAGHRDVTVLADRAALWRWWRRRLVAHLDPLVAALCAVTGRGPRALWACVEDACSGALHELGGALDRTERARADAALLLGAEPPLRGPAAFTALAWSGGVRTVRHRNGCCLSRLREGRDGRACFTCPLTTAAERVRRLEGTR